MGKYLFDKSAYLLMSLLCCPLWASAAVDSASAFGARIDIENYGIYQLLDKKEKSFDADATAGYSSVISTRHLRTSLLVPLVKGTVFGFNYAITDTAVDSQWIPVVIEIRHPETTNYRGARSTGFKENSAAHLKADGRYHNGAFYIFSEPYEMVAGVWTISVIYRDRVVASRRFIVQ